MSRSTTKTLLLLILLTGGTVALYYPSLSYRPVSFDDPVFITHNPLLHEGLSFDTVRKTFAELHGDKKMYVPMVWLSYLVDTAVWGASADSPRGFRVTTLLLHTASAGILFLLLTPLCRSRWAAFAIAAFWAWHPLRIESVAWLSIRKDVLSGFFALLTIGAYVLIHKPTARIDALCSARISRHIFLGLSLLSYFLGLLAKPMLVTIPFVLLLLDIWPLQRAELTIDSLKAKLPRLIQGKWFFFLLSIVAAAGVYLTQTHAIGSLPLWFRLYYLPANYWFYLQKTFLPTGLYPMVERASLPLVTFLLLLLILLALTYWVWRRRQTAPNELIGWLLFLGTLFPVSGIVVIGVYPVADRYSYLPSMGLSLMFISLLSMAKAPTRAASRWTLLYLAPLFLLSVLLFLTFRQLPSWRDDDSMYANIERQEPGHYSAVHYYARVAIFGEGNFEKANHLANLMLEQRPASTLGSVLKMLCLSQLESTERAYAFAKANYPPRDTYSYPGDYEYELAILALLYGDLNVATDHIRIALERSEYEPATLEQLHALAMLIATKNDRDDIALSHAAHIRALRQRTSLRPEDFTIAYYTLWSRGYYRQTLPKFEALAKTYPQRSDILNNIAWILATTAGSPAAPNAVIELANQALSHQPGHPVILNTLSVAYANAGDFEKAIELGRKVLALLESSADPAAARLSQATTERLELFKARTPYREQAVRRLLYAPQ